MNNPTWEVEVLLPGSWRGATSVLLSNDHHHIVVDSGMPHEAGPLVAALERKGLRPADIQTVINTHFHIDHVLNNDLFPAATVYATQRSHDWCQSLYSDVADDVNWERLVLKYYPEMYSYDEACRHMAKLRKFALRWWDLKRLGRPEQFRWLETHSLPEGIESWVTSGHVPGHVSLVVNSCEQNVIIAGDALLSREHEEQVVTMIPHNRRQFMLDRARILETNGRILPGHDAAFSSPDDPRSEQPDHATTR